jgi:hypothetical protein
VTALVVAGCVDIRPLNECSGILAVSSLISFPLRLGLLRLRRDKVEESPDSVAGIGTADTSDIIKAKTSTTRPARERIFEYCMIADQPIEKW